MVKGRQVRAALVSLILLLGGLPACTVSEGESLARIKKSGKIKLITQNNPYCYYIYRDRPMGFEYDLAKAFAGHLGVELEVKTPRWNSMFGFLKRGKGDFIAASLTITPSRERIVDFSDQYLSVQQHVIIHKQNRQVEQVNDLNGKTVHVRRNTSYHERLLELQKEGLDMKLVLLDNVPTEELIRRVAERQIEITVADSNVAMLNRRYYPKVRMAFPVSEEQSLGWAVRKGDSGLLREINSFLERAEKDGTLAKIYQKYYAAVEIFDYVDLLKFHQRVETRLPKYREIIKREASKYNFDWRLVAAMIYQESHFNPRATSYTGVRGLMQLTQRTAGLMGIENRFDPRQSIKGGVRYLARLHARFDEIKGFDRMLFALASYNIGYGHVRDAQKIARRKGLDPHKWISLEKVLPLLRYPRYYEKTRYGYARGTEPVRYVNRILTYYDILRFAHITAGVDFALHS